MKEYNYFTKGILFLAMFSSSVFADPVSINITGNVVASPCTVDTANSNLTVDLGTIQATDLATPASGSTFIPFAIKLKDCPTGTTTATITFSGTPDAAKPDSTYANTGTATNTAVELQGSGGDLFGNGKFFTGTIAADHTYTFNLKTRAYSAAGSVMPGTISAVVQANFTYN